MKNVWDRMQMNPLFQKWFEGYKKTANYFVASNGKSADELHAMHLCMAAAFEAALPDEPEYCEHSGAKLRRQS